MYTDKKLTSRQMVRTLVAGFVYLLLDLITIAFIFIYRSNIVEFFESLGLSFSGRTNDFIMYTLQFMQCKLAIGLTFMFIKAQVEFLATPVFEESDIVEDECIEHPHLAQNISGGAYMLPRGQFVAFLA